ncbi:MAG: thiol-activated cytolysin family protein, partial [Proteobacteria bacterium]|nr:thiol-activated cytolysin family protein [Pseudomonadota bacterium]
MRRLLISLPLLAACTVDTLPAPAMDQNAIDEYIAGLPYLPVEPPMVDQGTLSAADREGDYSCTTQNLKETRQYDKIVAYAANSDSLYPGALVSADSMLTGLFTQLVLPRAPETISVSLENLAGGKHAEIKEPSLSAYREALSSILDTEITGNTPANLYSEIEEVHDEHQLNMALGVEASWGLGVASLKTSFDFSKQETKSRYIVKYTQAYYTVDLDAPAVPSAVFAPNTTLEQVSAKIDVEHPPTYVSSVTYGRLVLFTFESEYSAEEMGAALEFAYSGGVDVAGDVSVSYKDIISKSKITAFILGGNAGTATATIDSYEKLKDFIKDGGNYSKESPGSPIAYKMNYLKDNSPARMSFTTDYTVKDCVRVSQKVKVTLSSIAVDTASDTGNDLEIYGTITAEGTNGPVVLFSKDSSNYVQIHEGAVFGAGAPLSEVVIDVAPHAGATIKLHSSLMDEDLFSDDSLGNETSTNPFETGWRKDVVVTMTGSGARVRVKGPGRARPQGPALPDRRGQPDDEEGARTPRAPRRRAEEGPGAHPRRQGRHRLDRHPRLPRRRVPRPLVHADRSGGAHQEHRDRGLGRCRAGRGAADGDLRHLARGDQGRPGHRAHLQLRLLPQRRRARRRLADHAPDLQAHPQEARQDRRPRVGVDDHGSVRDLARRSGLRHRDDAVARRRRGARRVDLRRGLPDLRRDHAAPARGRVARTDGEAAHRHPRDRVMPAVTSEVHPLGGLSWGELLDALVAAHGTLAAVAWKLVELGDGDDVASIERALRRLRTRGQRDGGRWGLRVLRVFGIPATIEARLRWLGLYHSPFNDLPIALCRDQLRLWDRPPIATSRARVWVHLGETSCALRVRDRAAAEVHLARATRALAGLPSSYDDARLELSLLASYLSKQADPRADELLAQATLGADDRACFTARIVDNRGYVLNKAGDHA